MCWQPTEEVYLLLYVTVCQCNGHSTCYPDTSECIQCEDLTTGSQCQYCTNGYYGDATNGGNCTGLCTTAQESTFMGRNVTI